MKCACTQENLSHGLSVVGHIASKNTTLPILNNILLRAENGLLHLSATNLEIGITKRIRGKIEKEGSITIPSKVFSEYVALLDDTTVNLEQDGATLGIKSDTGETKLRGMPAEDFPLIPKIEQKGGFQCPAASLKEGITQVIFAAAYDDARPEISGALLRFHSKELTIVATDSYRLAEKHIPLAGGPSEPTSVIVPVRALQELLRILGHEGETVALYLAENQILFVHNETELISRLIDGQYPNYEQIIPVAHESQATIETAEFVKGVRATSLFSRPGINDLTVQLGAEKKSIVLQAANAQVGENRLELAAKVEGKENSIVFNSRYLLDGLSNMQSPSVAFQMTNSASPGVFRPVGTDDYVYIIMPIKQ